MFIQSLRMQYFIHVSKNRDFLVPFLHHHHHPPYDQSDFDYVDPHPHHHRMLKVVVMFALRRSRPTHHTDRWHRAPKTMQNKQSVCDTAKKSSFGRCWNTCWLSLTLKKTPTWLCVHCTVHSVKWKYLSVVDYKSSNMKVMRFLVQEKNKEHLSFDSSSGWLVVHFVKEGDLCSDSRQLRREGGIKHKTSGFF